MPKPQFDSYFILQLLQLTTSENHWRFGVLRRTARECRPYVSAIAKGDGFCSHLFHLTIHSTHTSHVQTSCRNPFHYIDCIYCVYWIYCRYFMIVPKFCIPFSTSGLSAASGLRSCRCTTACWGPQSWPNAEKSLQRRTMNSYAWCNLDVTGHSFIHQIFLDPVSLWCFDSEISVRSRRRRSARCKELWQTSERPWTQRLYSPPLCILFVIFLNLISKCRFWHMQRFWHWLVSLHCRQLPPQKTCRTAFVGWPGPGGFKPIRDTRIPETEMDCPIFRAPGRDSKKCWGSQDDSLERFEALACSDLLCFETNMQKEIVYQILIRLARLIHMFFFAPFASVFGRPPGLHKATYQPLPRGAGA